MLKVNILKCYRGERIMKFSPNNSFVSLKAIFLREVFESFVVYKSA